MSEHEQEPELNPPSDCPPPPEATPPEAEPDFVGCVPKFLPEDQWEAAAATAIAVNPVNAPPVEAMTVALDRFGVEPAELTPARLAVLTAKYWGAEGVDLTFGFMEPADQEFRDKFAHYANKWGERANVKFRWTQSDPRVRVTREQQGYWSYLGTDILHIPRGEPTMCLQGFTVNTREAEWDRVVTHEIGHCLSGDTLIDVPRDLTKYPQGIPIRDLAGQTPWVYAWHDGRIVIRRASRVWLSKRMAPTVRVRLGTGQGGRKAAAFLPPLELVGTPDHLALLADGITWRKLGELKPGDRLCSLYRDKNGRRSRIRWTGAERIREHIFVCEQVYGPRPEKHDAHHKNENQLDQSPDNLEWKDEYSHHRDHSLGRIITEESRRRRSESQARRAPPTAETRAKMAASARTRPPISAETRAKISAASKGRPQSAELVAKRMAAIARNRAAAANHTVISVETAESQDVYDMTVPGADSFVANGVVVHNSLGFPHEQFLPAVLELLDPEKVIAWMQRTLGWSRQQIISQVLTPLPAGSYRATRADVNGCMMYPFPASVTRNGVAIPGGRGIDALDHEFCATIYPKADGPTGPTDPVTPPVTGGKKVTKEKLKEWLLSMSKLVNGIKGWMWGPLAKIVPYLDMLIGFLEMVAGSDMILTIITTLIPANQLKALKLKPAPQAALDVVTDQSPKTVAAFNKAARENC